MVQGSASKHRKWMTTGIFILLYYSVAILVDGSLFTKPHLPRYYAYIRYHVKTEIFPKHYFTFIFILCFEVALDYWMVQRYSLMKPWGAEVLDKVHKSGSLYACLINRETIKLKTSYIISNQVRNKLQIIDCLRFVLASFQDRKFFFWN